MSQKLFKRVSELVKPITDLMNTPMDKLPAKVYFRTDNFIVDEIYHREYTYHYDNRFSTDDSILILAIYYDMELASKRGTLSNIPAYYDGRVDDFKPNVKLKDVVIETRIVKELSSMGQYRGVIQLTITFRNKLKLWELKSLKELFRFMFKTKPQYITASQPRFKSDGYHYNYGNVNRVYAYSDEVITYNLRTGNIQQRILPERQYIPEVIVSEHNSLMIVKATYNYITSDEVYGDNPYQTCNRVTGSIVIPPSIMVKRTAIQGTSGIGEYLKSEKITSFYLSVFNLKNITEVTKLKFKGINVPYIYDNFRFVKVHQVYKRQEISYIVPRGSVCICYFGEGRGHSTISKRFLKVAIGPGVNIQSIIDKMDRCHLISAMVIENGLKVENIEITLNNHIVPNDKMIVVYLTTGEIKKFTTGENAGEVLNYITTMNQRVYEHGGGYDIVPILKRGNAVPQGIQRSIVSAVLIDLSKKEGVRNVF